MASACSTRGADLLVTSVGAFTDDALFDRLLAAAKANGRRLILPSAGIGALDILSGTAVGGLDSVTVTVRKDPSAWKGTIAETLCDLDALTEPKTVFDGPVREGARLYPQNVNISAAAAIAGIGLDRTRVVIVADPDHHHPHRRARSPRRVRPLHLQGRRRRQRGEPQDRQAGRHGDGEDRCASLRRRWWWRRSPPSSRPEPSEARRSGGTFFHQFAAVC